MSSSSHVSRWSVFRVPRFVLLPASRKVALVTRRQATLTATQRCEGNAGWMAWDPAKFQTGMAQADPTCLVLDTLEKSQQQGGLPLPTV